ncbi:bifunctional folylpolyglutamate synthase/dihydrofolate synthase [Teredinibacter franksiae]|uniref:bifunctional folylpolyglutamate synthase/dihydrofolate synthase n=1 Tax=Teredinibacter franksiae TaxID=2761453 RepID=UPI0016260365|nr:folylpolyglutamate synthase/dihydrofolate synthase family protein [Teredinibacter franksiae]
MIDTVFTSEASSEPRFQALNDWLSWMETLHPNEIDLGLERITIVGERLGFCELIHSRAAPGASGAPTVISIAGTNGKGSCVAALETLLLCSSKTTGSFTSPHLLRYNERVRVNGECVSDTDLCRAFTRIDLARNDISLTYFEFGALAAMLIFKEAGVDYWLLEVGLGGRLDAVNMLSADIAVVTSIDLDHQAWLGDTREEIAFEKVGILREGALFICAENKPPQTLKQQSTALHANSYWIGQDFSWGRRDDGIELTLDNGETVLRLGSLSLPLDSVAAAAQVFNLLGAGAITTKHKSALQTMQLEGRFSVRPLASGHKLILDVAHNPAASKLLAEKMCHLGSQPALAVFAIMADKDIRAVCQSLTHTIGHWFLPKNCHTVRAAAVEDVQKVLLGLGVEPRRISVFDDVDQAIRLAQKKVEFGTILVFGSFYTVADTLRFLADFSENKTSDD